MSTECQPRSRPPSAVREDVLHLMGPAHMARERAGADHAAAVELTPPCLLRRAADPEQMPAAAGEHADRDQQDPGTRPGRRFVGDNGPRPLHRVQEDARAVGEVHQRAVPAVGHPAREQRREGHPHLVGVQYGHRRAALDVPQQRALARTGKAGDDDQAALGDGRHQVNRSVDPRLAHCHSHSRSTCRLPGMFRFRRRFRCSPSAPGAETGQAR